MGEGRRIRVAVVYGGRSSEHDVSRESARSVLEQLDRERFDVVPIAIDREGRWHPQDADRLLAATGKALPIDAGTPEVRLAARPSSTILEGEGAPSVDVVFPVLHGPLCEDGSIQGLFDLADVAYVGSGVLGSAVCMDKDVAKRLVMAAGLETVPYKVVRGARYARDPASVHEAVAHELGYPVFVKPANLGSSVGIHRVATAAELDAALTDALRYDDKTLIERAVDAREIELSVLESLDPAAPPEVSLPGEIVAQGGFYDYAHKYELEDGADLLIPAPLDAEEARRAREAAALAFEALECQGMVRIDLFLERGSGRLLFNEANTIPGFTQISMYPKLWEASGLPYRELLTRLIELALARQRRRSDLYRGR